MKVTLDHYTPLYVAAKAIRKCWASEGKSDTYVEEAKNATELSQGMYKVVPTCGEKDKELIDRIGNKSKHASTIEHLVYSFDIDGISRACLQELARHRIASLSVKSTRYVLKELKEYNQIFEEFKDLTFSDYQRFIEGCGKLKKHAMYTECNKYLVYTGDNLVDIASILALMNLRYTLIIGIPNDKVKYCLPESYKTSLVWTVNARSLQNFLSLRTSKAALWEIRDLAKVLFEALPEDHKYLFKHCLEQEKPETVTSK